MNALARPGAAEAADATAVSTAAGPKPEPNEATRQAVRDTVLAPRFYTTDFAAMDRVDVGRVRADWDALMEEFRRDSNRGHFARTAAFDAFDLQALPPDLRE